MQGDPISTAAVEKMHRISLEHFVNLLSVGSLTLVLASALIVTSASGSAHREFLPAVPITITCHLGTALGQQFLFCFVFVWFGF